MKIAMYMQGMHLPGGVGSYLRRVTQLLRDSGHNVLLLDSAGEDAPAEGDVIRVSSESKVPTEAMARGADVLHTHMLLRLEGDCPLPIIRTVHNHDAYCPSGSRFLASSGTPCDRTFTRCGCLWGHMVNRCGSVRPGRMFAEFRRAGDELAHTRRLPCLAVSDFVRTQLVRAGYDPSLVRALPLPAPPPRAYRPPAGGAPPRFVFLGRLAPQKGIEWLIRATARVKHDVRVDVAGTGHPDREKEYRGLVEQLGLGTRITFHPWLKAAQVEAMLDAARALMFPSVWHEPAGLVALEAMAAGRAVIASRAGGIPEIVADHETGLLVAAADVDQLAAAIDRLAGDAHLATEMGRRGAARAAAQFSGAAHVDGLLAAYEQTIRSFRSADATVVGAV